MASTMTKRRVFTPKAKRPAKAAAELLARKDAAGLCAHDLLSANHPLHSAFAEWCEDKATTRRKARAFLRAYPHFRKLYASAELIAAVQAQTDAALVA